MCHCLEATPLSMGWTEGLHQISSELGGFQPLQNPAASVKTGTGILMHRMVALLFICMKDFFKEKKSYKPFYKKNLSYGFHTVLCEQAESRTSV